MSAPRTLKILAAPAVLAATLSAWTVAVAADPTPPAPASQRDGSHDFDPLVGTWKAKLSRLEKPLTGSTKWVEFEGTQVTRSIWNGRGTMDEFHVDSPGTGTKVDGLTVRLYNPESRQWSIYWANAKKGMFEAIPTVGGWQNGRGEFYDQEMYEGRAIFVRYVWSDVTKNSAKFVQSFSEDGGKTWEANWVSTIERVSE